MASFALFSPSCMLVNTALRWSALTDLTPYKLSPTPLGYIITTVRHRESGHLGALQNCPDFESSGLSGYSYIGDMLACSPEQRPDIEVSG